MEKVYCLLDNKSKVYQIPFYASSEGHAKFGCTRFLLSDDGKHIHPVDFDLFYLGDYDQTNGKFSLLDVPEHILNLGNISLQEDEEKLSVTVEKKQKDN